MQLINKDSFIDKAINKERLEVYFFVFNPIYPILLKPIIKKYVKNK